MNRWDYKTFLGEFGEFRPNFLATLISAKNIDGARERAENDKADLFTIKQNLDGEFEGFDLIGHYFWTHFCGKWLCAPSWKGEKTKRVKHEEEKGEERLASGKEEVRSQFAKDCVK